MAVLALPVLAHVVRVESDAVTVLTSASVAIAGLVAVWVRHAACRVSP